MKDEHVSCVGNGASPDVSEAPSRESFHNCTTHHLAQLDHSWPEFRPADAGVSGATLMRPWEGPYPMDTQFLSAPRPARLRAISCLLYTSPSPRDGLLSRMP